MNEHDDPSELPELFDDDVELLYKICKRASTINDPPFKALFAAYDEVFDEQQIEQEHDGVVFRYLMRVGEGTRVANKERRPVDLVQKLRDVLAGQNISFVEPQDEEPADDADTVEGPKAREHRQPSRNKRRVSFDDARLDETWLSEHSQPVNPSPPPARTSLLSIPPRRGRVHGHGARARSTSSQRYPLTRDPPTKYSQHVSPSTGEVSEPDDRLNPTLYFEPSQTQLELNAEAIVHTSTIRAGRRALHVWYDSALQRQRERLQAYFIATNHDRRTLLKQALDQWRIVFEIGQQEKRRALDFDRMEHRAKEQRDRRLLHKAFDHWRTDARDGKILTRVATHHLLKVTYFKRWRAIASENQMKVRRLLVRKYVTIWRARTARRQLRQEQAVAHYEESLMRRCKLRWFWRFCSRRVEGWHEQWMEKKTLARLAASLASRQDSEQQAADSYTAKMARRTVRSLTAGLHVRQHERATAQRQRDSSVASKCIRSLHAEAKLAPVARTLTLKVRLDLQRKAFRVWTLHLDLSRQAALVDRQRILQAAWTNWNDALRSRALAQRIDERVVVENLYRWVLQERLHLFQRTVDGRLLGRALGWWRAKINQERDSLANAEVVYAERQRRRRLSYGMIRLNIAMHLKEDGERAALEFSNSRALPKVLGTWKWKTDDTRRLAKWAADARFYCLCSSTLRAWKERTGEQQQNRRRNAYAHVRARVKIRIVGQCFTRWRTECMEVYSMDGEAQRRVQARDDGAGARAFGRWREQSSRYIELNARAANMDQRKLLASALTAVRLRHADLVGMHRHASDFQNEIDLALLAGALKRAQWATFTAARRTESAEALWARNRDQHMKQMLRHWASQLFARRAAAGGQDGRNDDDPESPSLRPASRAATRSADLAFPSSPPTRGMLPSTPGYVRTPSRSRRAGRFRPLPTPAPFTPMAFNSAYLATTPAPLPSDGLSGLDQPFGAGMEALTPQVTPFERKLRAGGFTPAPPSALRSSVFGRSVRAGDGTNKSVRFAGASRFRPSPVEESTRETAE